MIYRWVGDLRSGGSFWRLLYRNRPPS